MTPIDPPPPDDEQWRQWLEDARQALDDIKQNYKPGDKVVIDEKLYRRAMPFLLRRTHYKCAYCESIIPTTQPGDVEHYRPKGRIRELDGRIVKILLEDGTSIDHPGYWWLCYDSNNLLPACADCNRRRYHDESEGMPLAGKAELFPISGKRAVRWTDDLAEEGALLLNPADPGFEPETHFEFLDNGTVQPKTPEAKISCTIFGLNTREILVEQRAAAYASASALIAQFMNISISALATQGPLSQGEINVRRRLNDMWEKRTQYAAFVCLALRAALKILAKKNIQIEFPLPLN